MLNNSEIFIFRTLQYELKTLKIKGLRHILKFFRKRKKIETILFLPESKRFIINYPVYLYSIAQYPVSFSHLHSALNSNTKFDGYTKKRNETVQIR